MNIQAEAAFMAVENMGFDVPVFQKKHFQNSKMDADDIAVQILAGMIEDNEMEDAIREEAHHWVGILREKLEKAVSKQPAWRP